MTLSELNAAPELPMVSGATEPTRGRAACSSSTVHTNDSSTVSVMEVAPATSMAAIVTRWLEPKSKPTVSEYSTCGVWDAWSGMDGRAHRRRAAGNTLDAAHAIVGLWAGGRWR